jgi:ribosomal protein S6
MKNYKLICLLSGILSEEELNSLQEKIKSFIQEAGILESTGELAKKRFGYKIKGEELGYLMNANFNLDPVKLGSLEKNLKSETKILRYFIFNKKSQKNRILSRRRLPKSLSKSTIKIEKPKKVELKEIDKKIEEILGE